MPPQLRGRPARSPRCGGSRPARRQRTRPAPGTRTRPSLAVPANAPVPGQDAVLDLLLLLLVHVWDSVFEKLKTGRERGAGWRSPPVRGAERKETSLVRFHVDVNGKELGPETLRAPSPSPVAPPPRGAPCYSRSHTGSETVRWRPGKRIPSPESQRSSGRERSYMNGPRTYERTRA